MEKNLNVTVNGKQYAITYSREGDRYNVAATDPEIKAHIPNAFFIVDGKAVYMEGSPKTGEIFDQIIMQIMKEEAKH